MPEAARISDMHQCPSHGGGPVHSGSSNVIVGFMPAARVDDSVECVPVGATDSIESGAATVLINNRSAARRTDPCEHGGKITAGCPTVIIGDTPQSFAFRAAAGSGTPFCAECERQRSPMGMRGAFAPSQDDATPITRANHSPGVTLHRKELARQPDQDDGLDDIRRAARYALGYQFHVAHAGASIKPSRIWAHLRGIDISRPVEQVDLAGKALNLRATPGLRDGDAAPYEPDTSRMTYAHEEDASKPAPPDTRVLRFGDSPATGLRSVAAALPDAGEGGGTQIAIPSLFHAVARIEVL